MPRIENRKESKINLLLGPALKRSRLADSDASVGFIYWAPVLGDWKTEISNILWSAIINFLFRRYRFYLQLPCNLDSSFLQLDPFVPLFLGSTSSYDGIVPLSSFIFSIAPQSKEFLCHARLSIHELSIVFKWLMVDRSRIVSLFCTTISIIR